MVQRDCQFGCHAQPSSGPFRLAKAYPERCRRRRVAEDQGGIDGRQDFGFGRQVDVAFPGAQAESRAVHQASLDIVDTAVLASPRLHAEPVVRAGVGDGRGQRRIALVVDHRQTARGVGQPLQGGMLQGFPLRQEGAVACLRGANGSGGIRVGK